jgi:DNA mismatch repair protein MutH
VNLTKQVNTQDSAPRKADTVLRLQNLLPGQNLHELALSYGVTIHKNGKLNKGWVGQTLERAAQLSAGNAQRKDGFDFELKSTSLIGQNGIWRPKETIKITQLSPNDIIHEEFESSALWQKLQSLIFVGCFHESPTHCKVIRVSAIDIDDPDLVQDIRGFWNDVKLALWLGEIADFPNLGSSKDYIQLRPTGTGKNSSTCPTSGRLFPARAFYGTKRLLERIWQLERVT